MPGYKLYGLRIFTLNSIRACIAACPHPSYKDDKNPLRTLWPLGSDTYSSNPLNSNEVQADKMICDFAPSHMCFVTSEKSSIWLVSACGIKLKHTLILKSFLWRSSFHLTSPVTTSSVAGDISHCPRGSVPALPGYNPRPSPCDYIGTQPEMVQNHRFWWVTIDNNWPWYQHISATTRSISKEIY